MFHNVRISYIYIYTSSLVHAIEMNPKETEPMIKYDSIQIDLSRNCHNFVKGTWNHWFFVSWLEDGTIAVASGEVSDAHAMPDVDLWLTLLHSI